MCVGVGWILMLAIFGHFSQVLEYRRVCQVYFSSARQFSKLKSIYFTIWWDINSGSK